ncbi:palmdelphin-like [Mugil cephalus]|uniref:palmdelphin-like n=1 Tax=Mugil cephalus TaxID=48193 RepID=UPI001FB7F253|nr:palmdelphin-like [Mugil cephalus]
MPFLLTYQSITLMFHISRFTFLVLHLHLFSVPATFAMEISVEHDKRTGKSQVVSSATITPETLQETGLKVYDDGHKSVFALHRDAAGVHNGAAGEMTLTEVEELLRQATEMTVPNEVQYHQPVYSVPYSTSSRPTAPRYQAKTQSQATAPSTYQSTSLSRNGAQTLKEEKEPKLEGHKGPKKTPSPHLIHQESTSGVQRSGDVNLPCLPTPGCSKTDKHAVQQEGLTNSMTDTHSPDPLATVSIKVRSKGMPAPIQPHYRAVDRSSPPLPSHKSEVDPALIESSADFKRRSPFCAENIINTLPEELESKPITMIFMGFEKAVDEEENIKAELVIIGTPENDDEVDKYTETECNREENLSYHPEGYKSKVFQPKVGKTQIRCCRDIIEDTHTDWDDLGLHKPTFIHKPGKNSHCMQGHEVDEAANTTTVNMKSSTGR